MKAEATKSRRASFAAALHSSAAIQALETVIRPAPTTSGSPPSGARKN